MSIWRVFLDEINTEINELWVDWPLPYGGASSNQLKVSIEQKDWSPGARENSPANCL